MKPKVKMLIGVALSAVGFYGCWISFGFWCALAAGTAPISWPIILLMSVIAIGTLSAGSWGFFKPGYIEYVNKLVTNQVSPSLSPQPDPGHSNIISRLGSQSRANEKTPLISLFRSPAPRSETCLSSFCSFFSNLCGRTPPKTKAIISDRRQSI